MPVRRSTAMINARILLVNDNAHGLCARKKVLEELGHRIVTAASGMEALDHFAHSKFDLVVTDHKNPGMNGIELIGRLRKQAPNLPIVLVSGNVGSMGLNESNTGADVVIAKSANEVAHLTRAVSRLLGKKPPISETVRPKAKGKAG